jgi:hypothetical protein
VNKLIFDSYQADLAVILPSSCIPRLPAELPIHKSRLGHTLKKGKPQGRVTCNYSYGKPKILPKEKGGENQLNNVGKSKGTAAIPGGSPHNRGVAVDIQIGGGPDFLSKFKTDIYKWLKDNAYKYGFFNTGAKIRSTPEAWHWAYIPSQKGKKDAIITPPNSQNTDK